METQSFKIEISAQVTSQGLSLGLLNSVLISQCREIEEFLVDESDDGNITSLCSYTDSSFRSQLSLVRFQDFEATNVLQQIKKRFNDPVLSQLITDRIVVESSSPRSRRDWPQGPLLITLFVKFTKKEYIVAPFNSAPTTTKVEGACAICLEEMSEKALCQPPGCVHMFHEDCLTNWLDRHDSCPLCRQSTNPLTNKPSEALEKLGESFK